MVRPSWAGASSNRLGCSWLFQVEGKERKCQVCRSHLWLVALGLVLLSLTLCIFSLKYFWSPGPRKVRKAPGMRWVVSRVPT